MRIDPESTPNPEPELRGLEKFKPAEEVGDIALEGVVEEPSGELIGLEKFNHSDEKTQVIRPGNKITQRDNEIDWEIEDVKDVKKGKVVNLVIKDEKGEVARRLTLGYDELNKKLNTEGSPWHW
jgi:hypothetical protein